VRDLTVPLARSGCIKRIMPRGRGRGLRGAPVRPPTMGGYRNNCRSCKTGAGGGPLSRRLYRATLARQGSAPRRSQSALGGSPGGRFAKSERRPVRGVGQRDAGRRGACVGRALQQKRIQPRGCRTSRLGALLGVVGRARAVLALNSGADVAVGNDIQPHGGRMRDQLWRAYVSCRLLLSGSRKIGGSTQCGISAGGRGGERGGGGGEEEGGGGGKRRGGGGKRGEGGER